MKKPFHKLGAFLCAGALLATVGCDSVREYSVNSYQGILPAADLTPWGSLPPTRVETEVVKTSSVPTDVVPAAETTPVIVVPAK